jgi:hypothetical protein
MAGVRLRTWSQRARADTPGAEQPRGGFGRTLGTYGAPAFDPAGVVETEDPGWEDRREKGAPGMRGARRRPRRRYDSLTRAYALERAVQVGSARAVENELGLSHGTIRYWRRAVDGQPRARRRRAVQAAPAPLDDPPTSPPRPWMASGIERRPFDPEVVRARSVEAIYEFDGS